MRGRAGTLVRRAGAVAILAAALVFTLRPQAQEVDDLQPPSVTETELELYISVYGAMQDDHDLTIDAALVPHQMSVEQFRSLERRIQRQQPLIDRVRQALLERAKTRASSGFPPAAGKGSGTAAKP